MLVDRKRISIALGLLALFVAAPALAGPPSRNQETADSVAKALRGSQTLSGSQVDIETRDGLVTLKGKVASASLKTEAVQRTLRVPGVTAVIDRLNVVTDARVRPVQFMPGAPSAAPNGPGMMPNRIALGGHHGRAYGGETVYDGAPMTEGAPTGAASGMVEGPAPEGPAGLPGATQAAMPGQPNYAWPSYAPHPNFSAVGYPTVYPWQAWPNIGPFYPYPEVPLDWRAVTLRWDDGLWWLDFKKNYTRPFFTPYPFGIFGY